MMSNATRPTKRIVFGLSDKGGTGKSMLIETIFDRALALGVNVRAFDLDGTTGSFMGRCGVFDANDQIILPQPAHGVTPLFLHGGEEDKDRLEEMLQTGADLVIVDCPATTLTVFSQMFGGEWNLLKLIAEYGYDVTVVTVVTPFPTSIANAPKAIKMFPNAAHVVVKNENFGTNADYFLWDGDPEIGIAPAAAKAKLEAMGDRGRVITFPALNRRAAILLEKYNLRFPAATTALEHLNGPMRQRIGTWLGRVAESMTPADHLLGLAPAIAAADTAKAA